MRKIIALAILLLIAFSLSISINAENSKTSCIKDKDLREKLTNSLDKEEFEILSNKDIYASDVKYIDITDKPILKVFNEDIFYICHLTLDDIVNTISEEIKEGKKTIDYVIFDEKPIRLSVGDNMRTEDPNDYIITRSYSLQETSYITDVMNMSGVTEILNQSCAINNIFVFDMFRSPFGIVLYAETNNGIFVKYYPHEFAEGVWFTEEDFQKYGKAYYEYLISYERNYNEKGEALGGNHISLLEYIDTKYGKVIPPVNTDKKELSYLWFVIPVSVCITASAVILFVFRKKLFKSSKKA